MKFKDLLYSQDEEIPLILPESTIDRMAKDTIGRKLNEEEIRCLVEHSFRAIGNLIIKIGSSGIG